MDQDSSNGMVFPTSKAGSRISQASRIQETKEGQIEEWTRDSFHCGEGASEGLGHTTVLLASPSRSTGEGRPRDSRLASDKRMQNLRLDLARIGSRGSGPGPRRLSGSLGSFSSREENGHCDYSYNDDCNTYPHGQRNVQYTHCRDRRREHGRAVVAAGTGTYEHGSVLIHV